MENEKIRLAAVVGPTASGKTSLAVSIAEAVGGEVVSCDSMQIYSGMDVATAAPTMEERRGIPHHLVGFLRPDEGFSVAEYKRLCDGCIDDIVSRGRRPVLCGGTGLYYSAVVDGIEFADIPEIPELRSELQRRADRDGGGALLSELAEFDPQTAVRLEPADHKRIIRAIEVYRATGLTMTEHIARSKSKPSRYEPFVLGIVFRDRQKLYDRINRRVDIMLENGLLDEARDFLGHEYGQTAVQAIGYKELCPYLEGRCGLDEAVERLKMETRRYAKRQLSWFRRDERILWIYADDYDDPQQLADYAVGKVKEFFGDE